jgi:zinc-binding alcohol dehydrogenase family protein
MKAVAVTSVPATLTDMDLPVPIPEGHDLLVEVRAISVNPVDAKLRRNSTPDQYPRVLGYDATGIVRATGLEVRHFSPGDEVFCMALPTRQGTNAEYVLIDERLAGHKPRSLTFAEAAALPLTSLTAWEMLFDHFRIPRDVQAEGTLLIVGGAGGVGSMAIQLAAQLTSLTVVATASRPETTEWCKSLGAQHVLDHSADLDVQFVELGLAAPRYIFAVTQARAHFAALAGLLAPEGALGIIEGDVSPVDITPLFRKSAVLHSEYVFARGMHRTPAMAAQHRTLAAIAHLIDNGTLRTTMTANYGSICAENLLRAHLALESGRVRGKIVLEGF